MTGRRLRELTGLKRCVTAVEPRPRPKSVDQRRRRRWDQGRVSGLRVEGGRAFFLCCTSPQSESFPLRSLNLPRAQFGPRYDLRTRLCAFTHVSVLKSPTWMLPDWLRLPSLSVWQVYPIDPAMTKQVCPTTIRRFVPPTFGSSRPT